MAIVNNFPLIGSAPLLEGGNGFLLAGTRPDAIPAPDPKRENAIDLALEAVTALTQKANFSREEIAPPSKKRRHKRYSDNSIRNILWISIWIFRIFAAGRELGKISG